MKYLQIVTIEDSLKWDSIIKSFKDYDVYYLSGYAKASQAHGDGVPVLFYYEDNSIRGMNVVMLRDIAKDQNFAGKLPVGSFFDLATPYGYGGWMFEGKITTDNLLKMDAEYTTYCRNNGIVSEFVRFHPLLQNSDGINCVYSVLPLGQTIAMELDSRELIWNNLTSKNRNMIRKAQRNNIEIFWGRSPELMKDFVNLYSVAMTNLKADDYYYFADGYFSSILNDLRYNSLVFYAKHQQKIIAMSLILFANQKMHYHLSASGAEHRHLAPINLLLYEAACWGSDNGFKVFHLGGGLGSGEDSLYKFKSSFNKKSDCKFAIGKKIFKQEVYDQLVELRAGTSGAQPMDSFFPAYRAIFCR